MKAIDQFKKSLYKANYYAKGLSKLLLPASYWRMHTKNMMYVYDQMSEQDKERINQRVNYYNKITFPFIPSNAAETAAEFSFSGKSAAYCVDYKSLINYFPDDIKFDYLFGDITHIPKIPCFLKSRPIFHDKTNQNSLLLKLNKIRHYYFVKDKCKFDNKIPKLVWRGKSNQPDRLAFLEKFHSNPLCNIGDVLKKSIGKPYHADFMSIPEQLNYKYILSIEGKDVATNLKWIMASNSLCFMRKPRYETWFMEGTLIPNQHYVLLKDDYSDLEEKLTYFNNYPEEAKNIIGNANQHFSQFMDERTELLVQYLVMRKYLQLSQQLSVQLDTCMASY